jgi:hypothetical protein
MSCFDVLLSCFVVLKGPTAPGSGSTALTVFTFFAFVFKTLFFTTVGTKSAQNGNLNKAENHKNLQKIIGKTHSQSKTANRLCLEGVKPLE